MKKLTPLIFTAVLFMTASLISCAGSGGSSTETGYNTISWEKNLMEPQAKTFSMGSMSDSGDDALAVCATGEGILSSSDSSLTTFTAFAIASTDRTERLIITIANFDLFSQTIDTPVALTGSNTVSATYVNKAGSVSEIYTGTINATIEYTEATSATPDVNSDPVTYYLTTLSITAPAGFSIGSFSISVGDSITAMTYPFTEPTLY